MFGLGDGGMCIIFSGLLSDFQSGVFDVDVIEPTL